MDAIHGVPFGSKARGWLWTVCFPSVDIGGGSLLCCTAFGAQTQKWLFPTLCGSTSSGIVFSRQCPTVQCRRRLRCLNSCVGQAMSLPPCVGFLSTNYAL